MKRKILFRGQTRRFGQKVDMDGEPVAGNWVYGGIFQGSDDFSIIYGSADPNNITASNLEKYVVYTDTVGQYTNNSDMDGQPAFEGDIIIPDGWYTPESATGVIRFGEKRLDTSGTINLENGFWVEWHGYAARYWRNDLLWWLSKSRIIGNIHDNPELMESETACGAKMDLEEDT